MGYTLRILDGPERGKSYSFDRIEITVGRTMENDLVLPDPGISRQHMSIRDKGGAYTLKDLGSSNGTKLNGRKVREEVLKPGDVITLGGATVKFEISKEVPVESERGVPRRPSRHARRQAKTPTKRIEPEEDSQDEVSEGPLIRSPGVRQKDPTGASRPPATAAKRPGGGAGPAAGFLGRARDFLSEWTGKAKKWFWSLSKRLQIVLVVTLVVLVVVLVVKVFQKGKQIVVQATDHSGEEFMIGETDSDGQNMTYGLGPVSMPCRTKAQFNFKYANGRATVTYSVAGIDSKQELEIKLNNIVIGYAPITLDKWSDYIALNLPRRQLKENNENLLVFSNTVNTNEPNAKEAWAVEVPLLEETPLPSPDREAAKEAFKLAKERMKSKDVAPQNLFHALQFFRKSRDYLELLPDASRPDIYHEANEMVEKVERELEERIRYLLFTAEQAKEFERLDKAKNIYRQVLLTIPDQTDPRHLQAREKFEEIE